MDINAFWCIVLSTLVLWWFIKDQKRRRESAVPKTSHYVPEAPPVNETEEERLRREQRERDIRDLRKQGYTDELIAVILPTINN